MKVPGRPATILLAAAALAALSASALPGASWALGSVWVRPGGNNALCDGSADADWSAGVQPSCAKATVAAGIAAVDAGGAVRVAAGTYPERVIVSKALSLLGAGPGLTVLDGQNRTAGGGAGITLALGGGAGPDNVTISGLSLVNYNAGVLRNFNGADGADDLALVDVEASDNFTAGFSFSGNAPLRRTSFTRVAARRNGTGVLVSVSPGAGTGAVEDVAFTDVDASDNTGAGIHVAGAAPARRISFLRLTANRNKAGGVGRGLLMQGQDKQDILVQDGTFLGNRVAGIDLNIGVTGAGPLTALDGVRIIGNTVTGGAATDAEATDAGISVYGGAAGAFASEISGNTVTVTGRFGIEVKNCAGTGAEAGPGSFVVRDNTVTSPGLAAGAELRDLAGIAVYQRATGGAGSETVPTSGVVVASNSVSGLVQRTPGSVSEGFGIAVGGTGQVVRDNTVSACDVGVQVQQGHNEDQNNLADLFFGRDGSAAATVRIEGNTLAGNGHGVRVIGSAGAGPAVEVRGNELSDDAEASVLQTQGTTLAAGNSLTDSALLFSLSGGTLSAYANNFASFAGALAVSGGTFSGAHNWWGDGDPAAAAPAGIGAADWQARLGAPVRAWSEGDGSASLADLGNGGTARLGGGTGRAVIVSHGRAAAPADAPFGNGIAGHVERLCSDFYDFFTVGGAGAWVAEIPVDDSAYCNAQVRDGGRALRIPAGTDLAAECAPAANTACWDPVPAAEVSRAGQVLRIADLSVGDLQGTPFVAGEPYVPSPAISVLTPATALPGDPALLLTVFGSGFVLDSVVHWAGTPRPTTYVSGTELVALVRAGDLAVVDETAVLVRNPSPGGDSAPATFRVARGETNAYVLSVSPVPLTVGEPATVSVLVQPRGNGAPGGEVAVSDGVQGCTVVLPETSCTLLFSSAGERALAATYGGDARHLPSVSTGYVLRVAKAHPVIEVSSATNPAPCGAPVTLAAVVRSSIPGAGVPTGSLRFVVDGTEAGTVALSGGRATFTTTGLAPGAHPVEARYEGDGNFEAGAAALAAPQVVDPEDAPAAALVLPLARWKQAGGRSWVSDAQITDVTGGSAVDATVLLADGSVRGPFPLWENPGPAGTSTRLANLLQAIDAADPGDFAYLGREGAVLLTTQDAAHRLQASSLLRTGTTGFPQAAHATALLAAPGGDWRHVAAGRPVAVGGLGRGRGRAAQFGCVNPAEAALTVHVTLKDGRNRTLGTPFTRALAAESFQLLDPFRASGLPATAVVPAARAIVRATAGEGQALCFGLTTGGGRRDPSYHEPVPLGGSARTAPGATVVLPYAAWKDGIATAATITDLSGGSVVRAYFATAGAPRRGPFPLWTNGSGAGRSLEIANVLERLDALDGGSFPYAGREGAVVFVTQDPGHRIQVGSRTASTSGAAVLAGLNRAGAGALTARGAVTTVLSLRNDRSHRVLVSAANPAPAPLRARYELRDGAGRRIGAAFAVDLPAWGFAAFDPFARAGVPTLARANARLRVTVTRGGGGLATAAFLENLRTRDRAALPAVPAR